jgi:monofunctional biosynthetic peptidoglycan transglycosylase
MARRAKGIWRGLRLLGSVIAALVAIPLVLTPAYLVFDPISVLMLERYLTGRPVVRTWRDIDEVSDRLKASIILSEDGQFCRHWGVDLAALRAEVDNFIAGKPTRGASTLTMQVARNLFLWNDPDPVRKALEVPLALYVDLVLPKKRIMEIYLNIAEWGPGIYGIEAAAQHHFGVSAKQLSRRQAALLAVSLPNPIARNPAKPGPGLRRLASLIERRAGRSGAYVGCLD